jgi:hypothetical protein
MATIPMEDTYQDVEKLILRVARSFVRRYGGDLEITIADAMYHFVQAYESFDGRGNFEGWCGYVIHKGLLDSLKKELKRKANVSMCYLEDLAYDPSSTPAYFDVDDFIEGLPPDGEELVVMVFETPKPVRRKVKRLGGWEPRNIRKAIKSYVTGPIVGWSRRRTALAFKKVAEALS